MKNSEISRSMSQILKVFFKHLKHIVKKNTKSDSIH